MFIVCVVLWLQQGDCMGLWRSEITSLMFSDTAALGCVASVVTSHIVLSQDQVSPQGDVMLQYWGNN